MVVAVRLAPDFHVVAPPQLLFEGDYLNIEGYSYDYDPHRDRFLLVEPPPAREIRVVLDWFEEIRRLAPAGE